jgi:CelD/BcsL family acetyltransferase involved in cellulose biosynthesis
VSTTSTLKSDIIEAWKRKKRKNHRKKLRSAARRGGSWRWTG